MKRAIRKRGKTGGSAFAERDAFPRAHEGTKLIRVKLLRISDPAGACEAFEAFERAALEYATRRTPSSDS